MHGRTEEHLHDTLFSPSTSSFSAIGTGEQAIHAQKPRGIFYRHRSAKTLPPSPSHSTRLTAIASRTSPPSSLGTSRFHAVGSGRLVRSSRTRKVRVAYLKSACPAVCANLRFYRYASSSMLTPGHEDTFPKPQKHHPSRVVLSSPCLSVHFRVSVVCPVKLQDSNWRAICVCHPPVRRSEIAQVPRFAHMAVHPPVHGNRGFRTMAYLSISSETLLRAQSVVLYWLQIASC